MLEGTINILGSLEVEVEPCRLAWIAGPTKGTRGSMCQAEELSAGQGMAGSELL